MITIQQKDCTHPEHSSYFCAANSTAIMNQIKTELIVSEDGSHTLYVPELDEHYHSVHGAIRESEHVYIKAGLLHITRPTVNILEIGFGTGLNALLTRVHAHDKHIRYQTVEKYPINNHLAEKINYGTALGQPDFFKTLHASAWNQWQPLTPNFELLKWEGDFRDLTPQAPIDLVYFDAFGPDKHPDLWSHEVFNKINQLMTPGATLVTYCAKGSVRRMLNTCDFETERLPGPPHKREMLRATKK